MHSNELQLALMLSSQDEQIYFVRRLHAHSRQECCSSSQGAAIALWFVGVALPTLIVGAVCPTSLQELPLLLDTQLPAARRHKAWQSGIAAEGAPFSLRVA